ncbi:MAG: polyribonucleotide nucleotidyltransferase [Candidatus Absconditabacterales bacterium]
MAIKKQEFNLQQHSFEWAGKTMSFETGKLAMQAGSSIRLQQGDNVLLFTTCVDNNPRPGTDFLPLMIDYRESYSAAGRIAGAVYRRREAKACEAATLYARMADRALRPMFPKGMINSIVLSITPLSLAHDMEMDVATIVGSSLSIMAAGLPFDGPVGAVQIGYLDDKFIVNPTKKELEISLFNLLLAGKKGSINMIECGANEVPKTILKEAFEIGQKEINKVCDMQSEFIKKLTITEQEVVFNKPAEAVIAYISKIITEDKLNAMTGNSKVPFNALFDQYKVEVLALCAEKIDNKEEIDFTDSTVKMGVFHVIKYFIRNRTVNTGSRLDDRGEKEIRPLYCEVGSMPRVHGSGLFWRGDTQVMTTTTLGGPKDYLIYDDMENDGVKQRYFHHYNFPPFSVGEANTIRYVGRREIGHGKLAEKALMPMIPSKEEFPQCIRTVSECLGSGGSTSMGSVCASTLSLMDAGVPIKKPVAGIAMGLMTQSDKNDNITKYIILNDLQGTEDFTGDMDFKVAGTRDGVTAIQLDTKLKGLTMEIIHETIDRSIEGYNEIMDVMLETIAEPNKELRQYAPKIRIIKIKPDKVREVIGKGGDVINGIIDANDGVKIDFEDDGTCYIGHKDQAIIDKVEAIILEIASDLEVGQEFEAKIKRIEDYGLFVSLPKNKMGLCHISNLGERLTTPLTAHFKLGQIIKVKIKSVDNDGKVAVTKI